MCSWGPALQERSQDYIMPGPSGCWLRTQFSRAQKGCQAPQQGTEDLLHTSVRTNIHWKRRNASARVNIMTVAWLCRKWGLSL